MNPFKSIWALLTGVDSEVVALQKNLTAATQQISNLSIGISIDHEEVMHELEQILIIVQQIQAELSPPPAVALVIQTGGTTQGANGMLQVKDDGSVLLTLVAKDAKGNAGAALDAAPVWKSSDETLCTLNVAADGMTAVGVLSGSLGVFSVHVDGVAAGVALAADSDQITVGPGEAALLQVTVAAAPVAVPAP